MSKKAATRKAKGKGMMYSTFPSNSLVPPVLNPSASTGERPWNLN